MHYPIEKLGVNAEYHSIRQGPMGQISDRHHHPKTCVQPERERKMILFALRSACMHACNHIHVFNDLCYAWLLGLATEQIPLYDYNNHCT